VVIFFVKTKILDNFIILDFNYSQIINPKKFMNQYVAFLRGININGVKIGMPELKLNFEKLGYKNVITYLNTGNVKFETNDPIELVKIKAEKQISAYFGYDAKILVYNVIDLQDLVANYPFERDEANHAYAVLIDDELILEELSEVTTKFLEKSEKATAGESVIYWQCPKGKTLDTQFAKILNKVKFRTGSTTRNVNTLEKILK
jgi:uncharacterized protein (DUF1697 family)